MHLTNHKKDKVGLMAIKIDHEKAYDHLLWEFVKDSLEDVGFPNHLTQVIWSCISSTSMKALWNGEALESFSPSRRLLQGDPVSCLMCGASISPK